MSLNQELHEALGYCWHEIVFDPLGRPEFPFCKHCKKEDVSWHWEYPNGLCKRVADNNPDYVADPRLVIREIDKQGKRKDFINYLLRTQKVWLISDMLVDLILDTAGKLAQLALDWIKEQKEG